MNKIKVLQVGMTSGVGGVESFMVNILENIDKNKFDIEFLMHQEPNEKYNEIFKKNNTKIHYINGIKNGIFNYLKSIKNFYKKNKYDVVHLNECSSIYFLYCWPLIFDKKTKLIIHSHNGAAKHKLLHKLFCFIQNRRANVLLSCSDIASKWMFGKKKSVTIHNGIELEKFAFSVNNRNEIREELCIPKDTFIVGSIARFEEQKNHNKIIEIFYEYNKINSKSVLILVGDGSLKSKIENRVKKLGINDKVFFLGLRNDIPKLLSSFDLFLMPSLYEGLPFVCIESQANGLPMLVSNTISSEVLLTNLIEVMNLESKNEEWAKMIKKLELNYGEHNSNDYNSYLKRAGYDIKEVVKILESIYSKNIIGKRQ